MSADVVEAPVSSVVSQSVDGLDQSSLSEVELKPGLRPAEEGPQINGKPWVQWVDQIGLTGLTQNLAMQAAVQEVASNRLVFAVDPRNFDLLNQSHRQRIVQALQAAIDPSLSVEFLAAETQWETPAQHRRRKSAERQAQAVVAICNDPNIAALMQEFEAVVLEDSIQPL
jgi:DNA polymerase III subunit gamma/tau